MPGVPDMYQGTELWDFSLVDPDNRRPVDFDRRATSDFENPIHELVCDWRDARVKQALAFHLLKLRRQHERLFSDGTYEPLEIKGQFSEHAIAYQRRLGQEVAVFVVPRIASKLLGVNEIRFREKVWSDTHVVLEGLETSLAGIFSTHTVNRGDPLVLNDTFRLVPFAGYIHAAA